MMRAIQRITITGTMTARIVKSHGSPRDTPRVRNAKAEGSRQFDLRDLEGNLWNCWDVSAENRLNMRLILLTLLVFLAVNPQIQAAPDENKLPQDAADALHSSKKIILYSLEPWTSPTKNDNTLERFKVLGQITLTDKQAAAAITAFESAILKNRRNAIVFCFDPRHAIRVDFNGHTYEFLLCYACGYLYVYCDGKIIAQLDAGGSPKVLNGLLKAANIPLSKCG